MNETSIHQSIEALVGEEHELWKQGENGGLEPAGRKRLEEIGVQLDRFYDLLHQRQGLRDAGSDPSRAKMRSALPSRVTSSSEVVGAWRASTSDVSLADGATRVAG